MTATFDITMRITEREPMERMQFTAVGRAVKGAVGNVRATNTVRLAEVAEGTRVDLEGDLAMGGVLGSVGQKVVSKQVGQVTRAFAESLERSIKGEAAPVAAAAANGAARRPVAAARPAAPGAPAAAPAASAVPPPAPPAPAWQRPEIWSSLITLLAVALGYAAGRSARR
jgi:hypothetical protein